VSVGPDGPSQRFYATLARSRAPALALVAAVAAGCRSVGEGERSVEVLYAGSLTAVMEGAIGPAFQVASGLGFRGEPHGSVAGAHLVREGVRQPDVYVTADPATLALLGDTDPGWAIGFARGELVVAYAARGRFESALDSASRGELPWYEVASRAGFRLGRTEPELDPKGYRTLWMLELAETYYGIRGLAGRLENPAHADRLVYPEPHLAVRVETGELDAGVFYLAEALAQGLRVLRLPPEINQSDPRLAALYGGYTYASRGGALIRGSPILYAVTLPKGFRRADATNAGLTFLRFLLGGEGRRLLREAGFRPVRLPLGDSAAIPLAVVRRSGSGPDAISRPKRPAPTAGGGTPPGARAPAGSRRP